jgi:hypothetical protein
MLLLDGWAATTAGRIQQRFRVLDTSYPDSRNLVLAQNWLRCRAVFVISIQTVMGSEPPLFSFHGDITSVPIRHENSAQMVFSHAKNYIHQANETYRVDLINAHNRQQAEQRESLRRRIEEEERRARVLASLQS